jgi:O-antigen ligase
LVIPLFIGAGVVSFSRSGLAAIGSSMALVTLRLGLKRYLAIAVPCIVAFVAVYLTSLGASTVGLRIADYQGSLEERRGLWGLAARVAADHPVLGIGKGNWEAVSASPIIPHNTFLSVMVDGGLIGFAVFIIPIGVWLARGMRRAAAMPWAIAVFAGLVGGLAVSLDNFRPFWIAVGVLAAHLTASENYQGAVTAARASRRSPLNRHWR